MSEEESSSGQENPIQVDPQWNERNDSSYENQIITFTSSVTSSAYNFNYENGRRYHAYDAGRYVMPNDEQELDRLDFFHEMMLQLHDNKLHLAPIGRFPQRIKDCATGTGLWAIDMGDLYPSAEIIGNDLSPIQPSSVPPNVRFIVDNIEKPWIQEDPYDYIHCRYLAAAIEDWPALVNQVFQNLKPGGWAEFSDWDINFYSYDDSIENTNLKRWTVDILKSCEAMGYDPSPGPKLKRRMLDAGFEDVREHCFEIPTGAWPYDERLKKLGMWSVVHLLKGLEAFTLALFTRVLQWNKAEIQVLLSMVRRDLNDPTIHAYQKYYVAYGRKPQESRTR